MTDPNREGELFNLYMENVPPEHRAEVRKKMTQVALSNCLGCGVRPAGGAGIWNPPEHVLAKFNHPDELPKAMAFALCGPCLDKMNTDNEFANSLTKKLEDSISKGEIKPDYRQGKFGTD